jgi:hypothetical protein
LQTTWMHQSIVSARAGFVLRSAEIQLLLLNVTLGLKTVEPIVKALKAVTKAYSSSYTKCTIKLILSCLILIELVILHFN